MQKTSLFPGVLGIETITLCYFLISYCVKFNSITFLEILSCPKTPFQLFILMSIWTFKITLRSKLEFEPLWVMEIFCKEVAIMNWSSNKNVRNFIVMFFFRNMNNLKPTGAILSSYFVRNVLFHHFEDSILIKIYGFMDELKNSGKSRLLREKNELVFCLFWNLFITNFCKR